MTAPARLLSVRLQGFKSFAERTHVSFGPGISAVVGPNGSGKSNLADALRWALGEQGRALRSRKAEDVIWAGSERRSALGMADVQLVLDNADGLLPVEYGVVELGRRLYRSGENDYLLNRQRVRLRDLVDLLDAAHLAENAFLFIGQGMVDQALALRPEERRPLFEEVAGVRRHERRRRRAEEQLVESGANLARVEDILGELRPQARRLAAQAEQQASRRSAGDELAIAVLAAAHARWHGAAARVELARRSVSATGAALAQAMAGLEASETAAAGISVRLGDRARLEIENRRLVDAARADLNASRLHDGRIESELAGATRDADRLVAERRSVDADVAAARRLLAEPAPARDLALEAELGETERALGEALEDLATARRDSGPDDADNAAVRRLEAARQAERETARRRLADTERQAGIEAQRAEVAGGERTAAEAALAEVRVVLESAAVAEQAARAARDSVATNVVEAEADLRQAVDAVAASASMLAGVRGSLEAANRAVADTERGSFAAAARARGAHRLDRDVVVEPALRRAVDAALGGIGLAYVIERGAIAGLTAERGVAVIAESIEGAARPASAVSGTAARDSRFTELVRSRGGGLLADAVRRDERGALRALLARVAWLPDLAGCLELQADVPTGWALVPRDGGARVGDLVVALGPADGPVERQAEAHRIAADVGRLDAELGAARGLNAAAVLRVEDAREALGRARDAEAAAVAERHRAEERERTLARTAESAGREAAWLDAQAARLATAVAHARAAVPESLAQTVPAPALASDPGSPGVADEAGTAALGTWEARVRDVRARRDRIAALVAAAEARRQDADRRRAGAEAGVAIGLSRLTGLDTSSATVAERTAALRHERENLAAGLADATTRERDARAALEALLAEDAGDRDRLVAAEAGVSGAREDVRVAQIRTQAAERDELEAKLVLEGMREQLLVELAGLGPLAMRHLGATIPAEDGSTDDVAPDDLEAAVAVAASTWAATAPPAEPPSAGKLTSLRRRFHELGAGNPYAVDEYAALKARLDGLEAQRLDLASAIERTRELIVELDVLIAGQFRSTFAALEQAFDARFQQLFGGGFAHLSLTDPGDLSTTGIEIVARPPGKKAQALAMLSGGERALTAVALLFAMLEVRPVPFCVLDEVDAALDEANIGRFTDALRELSRQTQCIVITHNRGTIETADALYGVTVGDDSVSRVISLRLEEATELARQSNGNGVGTPALATRREG